MYSFYFKGCRNSILFNYGYYEFVLDSLQRRMDINKFPKNTVHNKNKSFGK